MLVHSKVDLSSVNGPGNRAVLWFQGCNLGCKGCWNPDTHAFKNKADVGIHEIQDWILGLRDIEGITFSGGEPMQHAPDLYLLVAFIREKRPDLSIGMFTGYSLKELEEGRWRWHSNYDAEFKAGDVPIWKEIKKHLDFAIMGRYNQMVQTSELPLRGSRNQTVEFFTKRYSEKDLKDQEVELTITDNLVQVTGFPVGIDPGILLDEPKPMVRARKPKKSTDGDTGEDLVCA
jgi:anaerobic ribonucleoside-triphosphate reductase activating protein